MRSMEPDEVPQIDRLPFVDMAIEPLVYQIVASGLIQ